MRRLALGIALMGTLIPGMTFALGLGEIKVHSALNEPLNAEIEVISASPDEVIDIVARLADRKAFERAGLDRSYVLTKLRFTPAVVDGRPVIRVTTREPVKEPFLDFLVDVNWPKGRLLREYTILLDPPLLMEQRAVATQTPVVAPGAPAEPAAASPAAAEPEPAAPVARVEPEPAPARPEPAPMPGIAEQAAPAVDELFPLIPIGSEAGAMDYAEGPTAETYEVKANDTLWEIANRMRPEGVSVNQMMVALLQANPDAFIRNNINNLKKGVILRMPPPEVLAAIDARQADLEVKQQYALWKEYRKQIAGKALPQEAVPPASGTAPKQVAERGGQTGPAGTGETGESAGESQKAELEILTPEAPAEGPIQMAGGEDVAALQRDLALAREQIESARRENAELRSRLDQLEALLKKQERLLNLKDEELAELRSRLQEGAGESVPKTEQMPPVPEEGAREEEAGDAASVEEPVVAQAPAEPASDVTPLEEIPPLGAGESPESPGDETGEASEPDIIADAGGMSVDEEVIDPLPAIDEPVPSSEPSVADGKEEQVVPAKPAAPAPASSQTAGEAGLLDRLLGDPKMLGMAGGGVVAVLLLLLLLLRRKRGEDDAVTAPEPAAAVSEADEKAGEAAESQSEPEALESVEETQILEQPPVPGEDQPEAEAPEPVDTEKTMVLDREQIEQATATVEVEAPAAESLEEDDLVVDDTVSEADVFLAYGLHDQAEELLTNALKDNPDNDSYRVKLLETWFATKDTERFMTLARELHERTGGQGKLWARAVVMGKELAPEDPLFAGADAGDLSLSDIQHEKPEAADIDLSGEDLGGEADFDLGEIDLDAPIEAETTPEAPAGEGEDLGMATTQVLNPDIAVDEQAEQEAAAQAADEPLEFDIGDLELGGESEAAPSSEAGEVLSDEEQADTASFDAADFDVEIGEVESATEQEGGDEETLLDVDIPELDELESNAPATEQMDISELDLTEFEEEETPTEASSEEEELLDLDDIELDLGDAESETEVLGEETELVDLEEDIDLDEALESVDSEQAISTKLDLAKAYIDMGDAEGARSTLEEVLAEGNEEQKKEAQALLDQIG